MLYHALDAEDPFLPGGFILPFPSCKAVFFTFYEPVHADKADPKYLISYTHIALQETSPDPFYT